MNSTYKNLKYNTRFILESRKDKETGEKIVDNVPILMSITFNGKRMFYYIGHRTDQNLWEANGNLGFQKKNTFNNDGISASIINASIIAHTSTVDKIFAKLDKYPSILKLRELLNKEFKAKETERSKEYVLDYYEEYLKERKPIVSFQRYKQLKSSRNHFERFLSDHKIKLTFENTSTNSIIQFEKYLKNETKTKRGKNTISSILKRVKAFFNYAIKKGWTNNNPFKDFKIEKELYGDPIFLRKEELDLLYNKRKLSDKLARVRDIFCLQCFIGARIGDFKSLKHNNIIDGVIHYRQSKKKDKDATICKIPLNKRAWKIIKKYNLPGGDLVPYMSDQKYNDYLKELFKACELDRMIPSLNPLSRETEIVSLYKIASSHMARRTFVGLLFKNTKNEIIFSMSGHVKGSKAFSRYYSVDEEDREQAIKTLE